VHDCNYYFSWSHTEVSHYLKIKVWIESGKSPLFHTAQVCYRRTDRQKESNLDSGAFSAVYYIKLSIDAEYCILDNHSRQHTFEYWMPETFLPQCKKVGQLYLPWTQRRAKINSNSHFSDSLPTRLWLSMLNDLHNCCVRLQSVNECVNKVHYEVRYKLCIVLTSTVPTCASALTFMTGDKTLRTTRSVYRLTAYERLVPLSSKGWKLFSFTDPLTRGSAPGPHWGLCPQTPATTTPTANPLASPLKTEEDDDDDDEETIFLSKRYFV